MQPILRYPLTYIAYHTYSFTGFMRNEFDGTSGWDCPCSVQPQGCAGPCTTDGQAVLASWSIISLNKWACVGILIGMAALYRAAFYGTLKLKEWRAR